MFDLRQNRPNPQELDELFSRLTTSNQQPGPIPQDFGLSYYHRIVKPQLAVGDRESDSKKVYATCRKAELGYISKIIEARRAQAEFKDILLPVFSHRFLYSDGHNSNSHSLGQLRDAHGRSVIFFGAGFEVLPKGCVQIVVTSDGVSKGQLPWLIFNREAGEAVMERFFETAWTNSDEIASRSFLFSSVVSYLYNTYGQHITQIFNLGVKGDYANPSMDLEVRYEADNSKMESKNLSRFRVVAKWDEETCTIAAKMELATSYK